MMFCDRCDRGYHTYCVGLKAPPSGSWICSNYCSSASNTRTRCKRCNVTLSQDTIGSRKSSKRSVFDKYCDRCFAVEA
uniref:PHD finger protein 10 n=1 Tax=Syphacia muris TaxID=451379 RepID=A0A0N5ACV3_9BILA